MTHHPSLPGLPAAGTTTGASPAVLLEGVSRSFGSVRAVDDLSVRVGCGQTIALLGPNGAGKTTAITMLLGLGRPDAGRIEVFGMSPDAAVARRLVGAMLQDGATGFVVKDGPAHQLAVSIRRAVAGERVIDTALAAAALSDGTNPLTPRERDVLHAASAGASIATIAESLFLSQGTVRNYMSSAIQKTGARNRIEAVRVAERQGWL